MKKLHFFIMFFGLVTILSMLFTSVLLPLISIAQGPGENCGEGKVLDCDLNCVSLTIINNAWDNSYCNEFLNCPEFTYDGYDCYPPTPGRSCLNKTFLVYDCNLNCVDELGTFENLNNEVCNEHLNCSEFYFDNGLCTIPGTLCGHDKVLDCDLNCINESAIIDASGDGICNEFLNCPAFYYDGGDCTTPGSQCGSGKVFDCDLNCVNASTVAAWTGDGWCDAGAWGMNLVCEAFSFDAGDCNEPGNPCDSDKVLDCDLNCVDASTAAAWIGDGWCDAGAWGMNLVCEAFSFDAGDCNPVAPINLMILMTP